MQIKPSIRSNIFTNSHPLGCQAYIHSLFKEASLFSSFEGPKNVLIIGGSSGYGLSSRITLAVNAKANTWNVSFESRPKGERTGSAGWWNNIFFQQEADRFGTYHKDFVGDAFSQSMKQEVIENLKEKNVKIDLIIYSLAAGARSHPQTGELVRSTLKAIGEPVEGKTIDIRAGSHRHGHSALGLRGTWHAAWSHSWHHQGSRRACSAGRRCTSRGGLARGDRVRHRTTR